MTDTVNRGGRPALGVVRTTLTLHPDTVAKAKTIGNGNVSRGVRLAVDALEEQTEPEQIHPYSGSTTD